MLLVSAVLAAGLWWHRRPSLPRLALLFGLYALGFGNHLMMVLLAPALVALIVAHAGRPAAGLLGARAWAWRSRARPLGASQYAWNAAYLWQVADPTPSLAEGIRTFWFDVTKSDWRSTMVMGVHETALKRRVGLYGFDLQQQVGLPGIVAGSWSAWPRSGADGGCWSCWSSPTCTAFGFAYTYNVGDVHVFFLPSHQIVILAAAVGAAAMWQAPVATARVRGAPGRRSPWPWSSSPCPAWRIWDTWPAVDRHDDTRPLAWLEGLTRGLGADTLLLADINWQLDNGLDYYTRHVRPDLNVARVTDRVLTLPLLVHDNLAAGRDVVMTPESRRIAEAAYGGLFTFAADPRVDARPLAERLDGLPADTDLRARPAGAVPRPAV